MTIDEVRQIWKPRADAKTKAIMDRYDARRGPSGAGHGCEGLGVYGSYQENAAREKVRLAVKLLDQAGLAVSYESIRKVTRQSSETIRRYWFPPKRVVNEDLPADDDSDDGIIIPFPGG